MDFNSINFPIVQKISSKLLSDDIIGVRPDETMQESLQRHINEKLLKERKLKIEKIRNKIKK